MSKYIKVFVLGLVFISFFLISYITKPLELDMNTNDIMFVYEKENLNNNINGIDNIESFDKKYESVVTKSDREVLNVETKKAGIFNLALCLFSSVLASVVKKSATLKLVEFILKLPCNS